MEFKNNKITYSNSMYVDFSTDGGTVSLNVSRKEVILRINDIASGNGTFSSGISHIYSNFSHINGSFYGKNWKLSCEQYIIPYNENYELEEYNVGDYIYIDGDGYLHRFTLFSSSLVYGDKYIDANGSGLVLTKEINGTYKLENVNGDSMSFDSSGKLLSIVNKGVNKNIVTLFQYTNGKLTKVYDTRCVDQRSRYYKLEYGTNGYLSKISLMYREKELETVFYSYSEGFLIGIYKFKNMSLSHISLYNYDDLGNMILVTGTGNNHALELTYGSNSVSIRKGISKVNLNGIIPTIGKEYRKNKSIYLFNDGNNSSIYSGEEFVVANIETTINFNFNYEYSSISNIFESSIINYYESYSEIVNIFGVKYRQYYNTKGFVTSVFEVDSNNNLLTLTKDSGIPFMTLKESDSINGYSIIGTNVNYSIPVVTPLYASNEYTSSTLAENYLSNQYNLFKNYNISFYIKHNIENATYAKVKMYCQTYYNTTKYIYVDKNAKDAWQYITIPITLTQHEVDVNYYIRTLNITLLTDGVGTYEIGNVRIKECTKSKTILLGMDTSSISLSDMYGIKYTDINNIVTTKEFDHNFFMTDQDIIHNARNMANNPNQFNMVYNAGTKIIPNVKKIDFLPADDLTISYQLTKNNLLILQYDVYDEEIVRQILEFSSDNSFVQYTICYLDSVECFSIKLIDGQGRLIYEVDANNRQTVNEFDDYGNLLSVTTALSTDFDSNNKVKDGKYRIYKRYVYDDDSDSGKYRENIREVYSNNSSTKIEKDKYQLNQINSIKFDNLYEKRYEFDNLGRTTGSYVSHKFSRQIFNRMTFDEAGRLLSITDSDDYKYALGYDVYGNINSYSLVVGTTNTRIKFKQFIPYDSETNGRTYIDSNAMTQTTVEQYEDKYGRIIEQKILDATSSNSIIFNYQEQGKKVCDTKFSPIFTESLSIAKLIGISNNVDNISLEYYYNEEDNICEQKEFRDNQIRIHIQQMDSDSIKYVIDDYKFKNEIIDVENNLINRVLSTKIYDDIDGNDYDSWRELTNYSFTYEYHQLLEAVINKIGNGRNTAIEYEPINGSVFVEKIPSSLMDIIGSNTYSFKYKYDLYNNLIKKIYSYSNKIGYIDSYTYDGLNRIKTENNQKLAINYTYCYNDDTGKDLNRLTKINSGIVNIRKIYYDNLNRFIRCTGDNLITCTYNGNYLNPTSITVNGTRYSLAWCRDNLLKQYGSNIYYYDHEGKRYKKVKDNVIHEYFYEGNRLIAEKIGNDYLIYMYDLLGLSGVRHIPYNQTPIDYVYAKDAEDNITAVIKNGITVVCEYYYDVFGNTTKQVFDATDFVAINNPMMWKSHYYDSETGFYYVNGRYYYSIIGQYIDCGSIENIISGISSITACNLYSLCVDNPVSFEAYGANIVPNTRFHPDPKYDPEEGMEFKDKYKINIWHYICAGVVFVISIVLLFTPLHCVGWAMLFSGISGAISGFVITFTMTLLFSAGNDNAWELALYNGIIAGLDGFTTGAIEAGFSALASGSSKAVDAIDDATDIQPKTKKHKHHILTNKNKKYINKIKEIIDGYGLDLDDDWNIIDMDGSIHGGRHPNAYHEDMIERLKGIRKIVPEGDTAGFLREFDKVKKHVIENPMCVRKSFYLKK